ncbi:preprotein translocase subunit SecG [Candidatus Babeliales bacterium]|nr:preprotein translocase subunit SecG [Candidatus Babeliales bacterium]
MFLGLIITLFFFACVLLVLLILIQKGKGSMGIGSIGGTNTMLFGGSGGQDIFQKATWILGAIFMGGSLILAIAKTQQTKGLKYVSKIQTTPSQPANTVKQSRQRHS